MGPKHGPSSQCQTTRGHHRPDGPAQQPFATYIPGRAVRDGENVHVSPRNEADPAAEKHQNSHLHTFKQVILLSYIFVS